MNRSRRPSVITDRTAGGKSRWPPTRATRTSCTPTGSPVAAALLVLAGRGLPAATAPRLLL
jgi:hypothetical protein